MEVQDLIFTHIENKKPSKSGWYLGIECADYLKDAWILWNVYWDKERGQFYTDPKSTVIIKADYWLDPKTVKLKQALAARNR
jgi:hypothetical protein